MESHERFSPSQASPTTESRVPTRSTEVPVMIKTELESALTTSIVMARGTQFQVSKGDHILAVNVGGTSVDTAVYEVLEHTTPELKLIGTPNCELLGGTFINDAMQKYAVRRLEPQRGSLEMKNEVPLETWVKREILPRFEEEKTRLDFVAQRTLELSCWLLKKAQREWQYDRPFTVSEDHLKSHIFEPVFYKIGELIQSHLSGT